MSNVKSVLVVDDNADIREMIRMILDAEGFDVVELDNGRQVNIAITLARPDLILLDIMLGDMDGRDICRQLKSVTATAGIPIIMVSATHGCYSAKETGSKADDYLAKPFDIVDLVRKVKFFSAA